MQVKTISKNIATKMEDWISSITDQNLRKALRDDVIVTGGSIASMFLNEEVNDYDVYIRTYDTLLKVVEYYTKDFEELELEILLGNVKTHYIKKLLNEYNTSDVKEINNGYAVAVRNLREDQIKLFIPYGTGGCKVNYDTITRTSKISFSEYNPDEPIKLFMSDSKYRPVYFSPNAISLSDNLQIIIRFWGEPDVIHKNYDFVHATNYFTFKEGLVTNKLAVISILTKQLMYQGSLYPVTSIIRTKKFVNRKWKITAGEMFKMIWQSSRLDLTDPDVLEEQLIGMDVAYFGMLIEALRKITDRSKLTDEYLFTIIDRIFDSAELEKQDE